MSGRYAKLHLESLEPISSKKTKSKGLPTLTLQTQQSSESKTISSIPELQLISQIPGSQPFLIQDLVPDVLFIFQYEGLKAFLSTLPENENIPRPQSLLDQTWEALLEKLQAITGLDQNELTNRIYTYGSQALSQLFARADAMNPSSLVFGHESQDIHVKTREIEIDIIKNEPEVTESATETCACGSKNVKTITVQMRGGDEPATIMARCAKCKLQWRFSSA